MTLMLGGAPFHSLALCRAKLYVGPIHEFAPNGSCTIGLKPFGYIPLLAYDMCVYLNLLRNARGINNPGLAGISAFSLRPCS